jgi:hypothetical protein
MNDWKECTWIEAANAFASGTHDAQWRNTALTWTETRIFGGNNYYRIREKQRTITVTIPRPVNWTVQATTETHFYSVILRYEKREGSVNKAQAALDAIHGAMEQQP